MTRIGRILRKLSIDELPQLFNVIGGSMSLIGPRPALSYELEHYDRRHFGRFLVRPGLSGLWQVSGRNQLGFNEMLDLDADYAAKCGPITDARSRAHRRDGSRRRLAAPFLTGNSRS